MGEQERSSESSQVKMKWAEEERHMLRKSYPFSRQKVIKFITRRGARVRGRALHEVKKPFDIHKLDKRIIARELKIT